MDTKEYLHYLVSANDLEYLLRLLSNGRAEARQPNIYMSYGWESSGAHPGHDVWIRLYAGLCFFMFRQFKDKRWVSLLRPHAPRRNDCYNHFLCARPALVAESWSRARLQSSKTVKVWCWCKELKPCQCEIAAGKIQEEEKIYNAQQYKITAGCMPGKIAKGLQRVLAPCRNRTNVTQLTTTHRNHLTTRFCLIYRKK